MDETSPAKADNRLQKRKGPDSPGPFSATFSASFTGYFPRSFDTTNCQRPKVITRSLSPM
jgi:hypothetical protein